MLNMLIRSTIIYIFALATIRLMGKRQIGEMQPFEFVITLIIADLVCIPMQEISVPLLHGIVPILTLLLLHYFLCLLSRKSIKARYLISGRSAIVISPNGIHYKELQRLNMTIDDLIEALRGVNIFNIEDVAYAIFETNGNLSVLPKSHTLPATKQDIKINSPKSALPISIIIDGKVMKENISLCGLSEEFFEECLKQANLKKINDIMFMNIDNNGKVFLQPKIGKYITFERKFFGGCNW